MLRDIHLYGALRKKYGKKITIDVETPGEIVRALVSQIPGFRHTIASGTWCFVRGDKISGEYFGIEELNFRLGSHKDFHIFPAPKGKKSGGVGKAIIGAIVIIAAVAFWYVGGPVWAAGYFGIAEGTALALTASVGMMGVSMVVSGVSMMLAPQPKAMDIQTEETNQSFIFSGPQNSSGQGYPIPLVYGKVRVGSIVGSAKLETTEYSAPPVGLPAVSGAITSVYNTQR